MDQEKKHFAFISINKFNPNLCDGVSISMLELLLFLKRNGKKVSIFNFFTNEPYKKYVFHYSKNYTEFDIIDRQDNAYDGHFKGIDIYQEVLPYSQNEVHERYSKILKTIISKIQKQKIDYVFTIEDDFVSLLSVSILGIPGAHFFHSLPYVKAFIHNTLYIKFLQKRSIFAVSKFIQIKVKYLLGVNAAIWCPIINFSKYRISSKEINSNVIGFYSGGRHKGDEIINKIIEKMPRCNFIVIGRNYQNQFKEIPGNLKYLGDLIDIKTFYEQIKLLLVPSVIEEAFPRVILETAINGIPVIANNVGGITEALGNSGISIDIDTTNKLNIDEIADKYIFEINRLLNNDLEYTIYSKKALMRAKEYQIEQEKMSRYIYEKFIKTAPENPVLWTGIKGASAKGRKNVI